MPAKVDLLGQVFGTLTVVEELNGKTTRNGYVKGRYYRCECSCGGEVITTPGLLRHSVRSCKNCAANNAKNSILGKIFRSNKYGDYKVVTYVDCKQIEVEFISTGFRVWAASKEVRRGAVRDLLAKSVYGVGYVGVGEYEGTTLINGKKKNSPAYEVWIGILKRCYSENANTRKRHSTYADVSVCEEWLCFQNFAKWYYNNLPSYSSPEVDKDLRVIGSRVYSPETCSFVPVEINALFTGPKDNRELQRGVHFCNTKKLLIVQLQEGAKTKSGNKKQTYYGSFSSQEEAFAAYFREKKRHVIEVANRNIDKIHPEVYHNLVNNFELFLK